MEELYIMEALDPELNAAILNISSHLFPDGFDISAKAPETYENLRPISMPASAWSSSLAARRVPSTPIPPSTTLSAAGTTGATTRASTI
jgi:hypothetical protein